ncbi:GNAT family N-acetyltransferase [Virgibacillus halodenitrificans]|uniref:GNAT family N-acetyltransferase n=1 Tax=Virgibacillus halodenitrificans TaxID=1482 RepID=UPI001F29C040|nr:GNAT family N-acetyltransferase [Virgibacillus halodenitrificans]
MYWVEIIPAFQGKGLGKPLISKAMQTLAHFHDQAYLKTQSSSKAAIHLYKKLGWEMV